MSAFNGSGTFIISGTGLPFVTATTISSTVVNQLDTDLATGLSTAICKDGQTTITANIPLAGFKLTGVGAATTTNDALTYGTGANSSTLLVPTRQTFTSGSAATYTTPTGCRQLRIRMVAAGGGSGGGGGTSGSTAGGTGGTTTFNSINATGGGGGGNGDNTTPGAGGVGGTGGTGSASFRAPGSGGAGGQQGGSGGGNFSFGVIGGSSLLGGATAPTTSAGNAGIANTGSGASGSAGSGSSAGGGAGGAGEYVELVINNPSGTYTYTIGAGGTAGAAGNGLAGAIGGSGLIIVDEIY